MTTDYRALCAELLRGLDENRHPEVRYPGHLRIVMARARAALAQPEPVGVTDEELHQLWLDLYALHDGPTSGEVAEIARAVLARWGRPATTPIPVSERLPGPEDCASWPDEPDCDPWCWAARDIDGGWEWTQLGICHFTSDLGRVWREKGYTHWLPAHDLPLPRQPD